MLKSEILELVKELEDGADIDEIILNQGFAKPIKDLEGFKQLLASNDGKEIKGYYQSALDSGIGKGVNTFKENFNKNELPKLVEAGIKAKSNEGKPEWQIELEEERAKREALEKQIQMKDLSSKYTKVLSEKQLPIELVDYVLSDDEEKINSNIEFFSNLITNSVNNGVKQRLVGKDETPPKNETPPPMDDFLKGLCK